MLKNKLHFKIFKKVKKWDENYLKFVVDVVVSVAYGSQRVDMILYLVSC